MKAQRSAARQRGKAPKISFGSASCEQRTRLSGVGWVPRRVDDRKCRPGSAAGASVQPNRLQKQGPGLRQVNMEVGSHT